MATRPTPPQREQPTLQRRRPAKDALEAAQPWDQAQAVLADASAIQALQRGEANPDEQRRALNWILKSACALPDWAYRPGTNDRDTNIALGRQHVGHQIMRLIKAPLASMRRTEAQADDGEPQA
ncbi:MAG TPA: hypothetical protein VE251_14675 [Xanthobacteraceae bacterium]|jgi:hypothetical protein|nr:hypothetical protein [Xanthobacteraceae bacterium]